MKPKPACARCGGRRLLTRAGASHAEARLCPHLRECPRCGGEGWTLEGAPLHEVAIPCGCELRETARRAALYDAARLPSRFFDARLDTFERRDPGGSQHRAKLALTELADSFRLGDRGVGLSGPPGVGKTHLLCALASYFALGVGLEVRYADFADLIGMLRSRFDAGGGAEALVGTVAEAPVLFIDELGKGRATEWEQSIVDAIVSQRYRRGLSTFFATNYAVSLEDGRTEPLSIRVGERAMSRLGEMCDLIVLDGPDGRAPRAPAPQRGGPPAGPPRGVSRVR